MDFAFAPGHTDQDGRARRMFRVKPGTTLVAATRSRFALRHFIQHVDASHGATPVDNLLVAAHANDQGDLDLLMFRGQTEMTDFETLEETLANAARSIVIPVGITPANFHIRGCNLGAAEPFLVKLREALGGGPTVTAPRHLHFMSSLPGYGVWEAMAYAFILHRHPDAAFQDQAETIAGFQAGNVRGNFRFIDGTIVPPASWANWIPKQVHLSSSRDIAENLGVTIGTRQTIIVPRQFNLEREQFTYTITFPVPNDVPRADAEQRDALEDSLALNPEFDAGHDFPKFERWGYASVDDFLDGFEWTFRRRGRRLLSTGARRTYMLILGIRDLATHNLIFNFYPFAGTPHAAITTGLIETDGRFFVSA
jgi:hypothetical protein